MNEKNHKDTSALVPDDLVKILVKNERKTIFTNYSSTHAAVQLYNADQRLNMVEDYTLQENIGLLIGVRKNDKLAAVLVMVESVRRYLMRRENFKKETPSFFVKSPGIRDILMDLVDKTQSYAKNETVLDSSFRGTLCARLIFETKVSKTKDGSYVEFSVIQSITHLADMQLVKLFSKSASEAPSIVSKFSFSIKL